ncbi:MAG: choice-of-anchor L domain-containing protein [Flavobacteriales bacterium]
MRPVFVFLCIVSVFTSGAQTLSVNNTGLNSNPAYLLANRMIGGGMNVFNVSFAGNASQQIGYYTTGTNAIGSASGVAISTGNVQNLALHNVSTSVGGNLGAINPTDADILLLANGQTVKDWFILEFDFIPSGDELNVSYVFGSEEYGEYVCAANADIFAVLVSGSGMVGPYANAAENIATVPSTSDPAGINSINDGVVGPFGVAGGCTNGLPSPYFNANTDTLQEMDGYTNVMTINRTVVCVRTHTICVLLFSIAVVKILIQVYFFLKAAFTVTDWEHTIIRLCLIR